MFVTLTYAHSLDGSIAHASRKQLVISGKESMILTHYMRTIHDCILVGIGTLKNDNPSLTARFYEGPCPKPVILDSNLNTPLSCKLLTLERCVKPIIICLPTAFKEKEKERDALILAGAEILVCEGDALGHVNLRHAIGKMTIFFLFILTISMLLLKMINLKYVC